MGIISDKGTSVAFFTLVLFVSAWYHIKKAKHQLNQAEHEMIKIRKV